MKFNSSKQTAELKLEEGWGDQLELDVIFSNHKGVYKKRIEKRQTKLLEKVSSLKSFLKEGERIHLITTGCSPTSILEQMLTGWIFIYIKRSLFVFTNKRIFHIPTKRDYSYRNSIAHIIYADCKSIQIKGRKLVVEYKKGTKEKFLYIPSREKKKINNLLGTVSYQGTMSKGQKRNHLCPRCTKELSEGKYTCPNCHIEFKDKAEGKRISIIYPGGGYFYTGHTFLGIGDAIVEIILIILVIVSLIDIINGVEGSGAVLFMFAIILVIEKLITVYHSNHFIDEFISKSKEIKTVS